MSNAPFIIIQMQINGEVIYDSKYENTWLEISRELVNKCFVSPIESLSARCICKLADNVRNKKQRLVDLENYVPEELIEQIRDILERRGGKNYFKNYYPRTNVFVPNHQSKEKIYCKKNKNVFKPRCCPPQPLSKRMKNNRFNFHYNRQNKNR